MVKDVKKTVLYIVGAGSTGSTLVSMVLGGHGKMFSVGELSRFDQYKALDMDCTCGQPVSQCDFWVDIDREKTAGYPAPLRPMNRLINVFWHKNNLLKKDPNSLRTIEHNLAVYQQIFDQSGADVIVDSSKDVLRLTYLFRSGHIKLVPLYMVRDVRAYMASMQRRGYPTILSYARWVMRNLVVEKVLKQMRGGDRILRLDYDVFTIDSEACLKKICAHLGLRYQAKMLDYYKQEFHNIAGTPGRFEPKPIAPNLAWKDQLSPMGHRVFKYLGGDYFNQRFGVGRGFDQ